MFFSDVGFVQTFHFWVMNKEYLNSISATISLCLGNWGEPISMTLNLFGVGDWDEGDVGVVQSEDGDYA